MNLHTLRSREVKLISDFIHELYTPVSAEDFPRHLIRTTGSHFPGYHVSFDESCPQMSHYHVEATCPLPCPKDHISKLLPQNPSWQYVADGGKNRVLMVTDFISQAEFAKTDFYHDILKPLGGGYQLAVALPSERFICGMHFHLDRPIPETLRILLHILSDHIIKAHKNAHSTENNSISLNSEALCQLGLSRREAEVLRWIADGKRDADISLTLGISRRTVSKHVEHILTKLNCATRTAAVSRSFNLLQGIGRN